MAMTNKEAAQAAKQLHEFCKEQYCPNCVFNNGKCMLGGLCITPTTWNDNNQLLSLVETLEAN